MNSIRIASNSYRHCRPCRRVAATGLHPTKRLGWRPSSAPAQLGSKNSMVKDACKRYVYKMYEEMIKRIGIMIYVYIIYV